MFSNILICGLWVIYSMATIVIDISRNNQLWGQSLCDIPNHLLLAESAPSFPASQTLNNHTETIN